MCGRGGALAASAERAGALVVIVSDATAAIVTTSGFEIFVRALPACVLLTSVSRRISYSSTDGPAASAMAIARPRGKTSGRDHRPRVARQRRARMRARILAAAMDVFAEKGPDAPVIDDFVRAAGIARGTFYSYFTSTEELLTAVSAWLEDSLIRSIEAQIGALDDPVLRMATGMRLWLRWSIEDRAWSAFVVRSRFRGRLVERRLNTDLRDALDAGLLQFPSVPMARDLVVGTILQTMRRIVDGRVPASLPEDTTRLILRGLGLGDRAAARAVRAPAPVIGRPTPAAP